MKSDERDALFFDALLGERPIEDVEQALTEHPEDRAEWDELRTMWSNLETVLADPVRDSDALAPVWAPRRGVRRWVGALLAACVATFLLGAWLGGFRNADLTPVSDGPRFAVLLYAGGSGGGPGDPELVNLVVEEQRAWSDQLRVDGRHVLSEKLTTRPGIELRTASGSIEERAETSSEGSRLGGLYVITAKDLREATDIARDCPLLRYGGTILVRAIDDV